MGATLATVDAIMKEVYEKDVQEQLNSDAVGWKRIQRSSEGITDEIGGKYVTFPIKTKRNHGVGARNENEALPVAGQQGYAPVRVRLNYLYGAVRLTGQSIRLSDSNYKAFAAVLDEEMSGIKTDLAKDMNFQFYGAGSGVRAAVTADAANTITVDNIQYLEEGMMIDVLDTTLVTTRIANRMITAINETTKVVTYNGADGSASIVATDKVVRTGNVNREITGLNAILQDTGALYDVDPAVERIWKAAVNHNAGTPRALSEALMIQTVDAVRTKGGYPSVGFTSLGVRRAYFNLLKQERRFVNTQKFEGGFEGLAFTTDKGDIPIIVDVDAPFGQIQFVDEKQLKLYREGDWSWMNMDGSIWQRVIGFDAYEATMFMYAEMGTHRRNSHASLRDLTEG